MTLAYYNDNGAYKPWTADMVGGLDKGISNLTYVRVLGSDNAEDWDTLSQGIYYIAGATLTEAKHCPMVAYSFGVLIILEGCVENSLQLYFAHKAGDIWYRQRWQKDNPFTNWTKLVSSLDSEVCVSSSQPTNDNVKLWVKA